jgi:hypothetical protein
MLFYKDLISRCNYFIIAVLYIALSAVLFSGCTGTKEKQEKKLILSFYVDDTSPGIADPEALGTFLDFCKSHGIKGESTVVLGYDGESMADDPDSLEQKFLEYAGKSYDSGIDTHMEIMTHHELFDFEAGKMNEDGIHEGLWLHEPDVTVDVYRDYFSNILADGEKAGFKFTGFTWPGCGCEACSTRYAELREEGPLKFNPAVFEALIDLVKQGRFRTRVIPIFYESSETDYDVIRKAVDGDNAVYDLMPNAEDQMGIWENTTDRVDPDYYITGDGKSGIIVKHLEDGAPYCMWYMHWQGLNPESGVGWEAFKTVIERIEKYLGDRVVWMRPSDIVTQYHKAGGWEFINEM